MIIHNVEQGSHEWHGLRLGIPTVSRVKDLITSTGKLSSQRSGYVLELLAEAISGEPFSFPDSFAMRRGRELEPEAASVFEFQTDLDTREIGFVTDDKKEVGCSPDRLVGGGQTGLEIKCPGHKNHMKYLMGYLDNGDMPGDHYGQVQGTMWIMDMKDYWFMSYHPNLPSLITLVDRDDEYIASLSSAMKKVVGEVKEGVNKIRELL